MYIEWAKQVKVGTKKCPNPECKKENYFDGRNVHVLNADNEKLFDHGVFNGFTVSFSNQSRPSLGAYLKEIMASYLGNNCHIKFLDQAAFALFWRSFICLQDWKFSLVCVLCDRALKRDKNSEPNGECDEVVADGVCTGFNKKYAHSIINPKHVFDKKYYVRNVLAESDRYIADAKKRKDLERLLYQAMGPIPQDRVCCFPLILRCICCFV